MQIKFHHNRLILKTKFTISHGAYNHRDQLLVELSEKNVVGLGETIAIDYYGQNIDQMLSLANIAAPQIAKISSEITPRTFYKHLINILPANPFLRSAFETAFYDLYRQLHNQSLDVPSNPEVPSSITIGLSDSLESLDKKLEQRWPFYKVKINQDNFRKEVINRIVNAGKAFGVDANGAFDDMGQAQKSINYLQSNGCVYIEQLLSKTKVESIKLLDRPSESIFLVDESIATLNDAKNLVQPYDGYVLKLTKCGGITPTLDIIHYAQEHSKKLLAGCMTETSIGINHMLRLLPYFDYADLDGAFLISNDADILGNRANEMRFLQDNGYFTT